MGSTAERTMSPAKYRAALLTLFGLPILGATVPADGQSIECVRPVRVKGICKLELSSVEPLEAITVRIRDQNDRAPVPSVPVTFTTTSGRIFARNGTNSQGLAVAEYSGRGVETEVTITATATVNRSEERR